MMIGHTFKRLKRHVAFAGGPWHAQLRGDETRPMPGKLRRAPRPRGWHNAGQRSTSVLAEQMLAYTMNGTTGCSVTRRWPA
jgi:hypothetical protein